MQPDKFSSCGAQPISEARIRVTRASDVSPYSSLPLCALVQTPENQRRTCPTHAPLGIPSFARLLWRLAGHRNVVGLRGIFFTSLDGELSGSLAH